MTTYKQQARSVTSHIALTKGTIRAIKGMMAAPKPSEENKHAEFAAQLVILDKCLAQDTAILNDLKSKIAATHI